MRKEKVVRGTTRAIRRGGKTEAYQQSMIVQQQESARQAQIRKYIVAGIIGDYQIGNGFYQVAEKVGGKNGRTYLVINYARRGKQTSFNHDWLFLERDNLPDCVSGVHLVLLDECWCRLSKEIKAQMGKKDLMAA